MAQLTDNLQRVVDFLNATFDIEPIRRETVNDALENVDFDCPIDYWALYIFYDGDDKPLYIGRSQRPHERIQQHLGRARRPKAPSKVGRFILDNLPESKGWAIEYRTVETCADYVAKQFPDLPYYDVDIAETALIREIEPRFNVIHNG